MSKGDWWNEEIALYVKGGADPEKARIVTILRWMYHGDFRPLAAAIIERQIPEEALTLLVQMIDEDRLKLAHAKRHRPKSPMAQARRIAAARLYQERVRKFFYTNSIIIRFLPINLINPIKPIKVEDRRNTNE
jgi:hypothetical protein